LIDGATADPRRQFIESSVGGEAFPSRSERRASEALESLLA
jgi:hypothetical protein